MIREMDQHLQFIAGGINDWFSRQNTYPYFRFGERIAARTTKIFIEESIYLGGNKIRWVINRIDERFFFVLPYYLCGFITFYKVRGMLKLARGIKREFIINSKLKGDSAGCFVFYSDIDYDLLLPVRDWKIYLYYLSF